MLKTCNKCDTTKPLAEFPRKHGNKDGHNGSCKECFHAWERTYRKNSPKTKANSKRYRDKTKDKMSEYGKTYRKVNSDKISAKKAEYYLKNKSRIDSRIKEYGQKNKEKLDEYYRQYRKENSKDILARGVEWAKRKRKEDEFYRMKSNLRSTINFAFRRKKWKKNTKTQDILGCDFETLYTHLLNSFVRRYGREPSSKDRVEIDHIIPLASANSSEELIQLSHYSNLQWLTHEDNYKKRDRLDFPSISA
jgi:hypothetical protein